MTTEYATSNITADSSSTPSGLAQPLLQDSVIPFYVEIHSPKRYEEGYRSSSIEKKRRLVEDVNAIQRTQAATT